jgi:hypothetical protein
MSAYIAIIASIMMLATNAAWGRDRAVMLAGVDHTAVSRASADNGIPATWAAQYGIDQKALNPMQTSAAPNAGVVLTAGQGGGTMRGSVSGRSNWGHSSHSRPFGSHSFNRGHSFNRDFDQGRFHHRDHFSHRGFRHYPYGHYYSYPYRYYPYRYYYPYSYYYPYGYYYGYPGYVYTYPYSYFYFSW